MFQIGMGRQSILFFIIMSLSVLMGCSSQNPEAQDLGSSIENASDSPESQAKRRPPLSISNGPTAQSITSSTAKIQWTLSNYGTGQVEYGLTTALGSFSAAETSFSFQSHSQTISNLQAGKTYYYRVISKDSNGQQVVSSRKSFKTLAAPAPSPTPAPAPAPTPTPPTVTITSPVNGATVSSPATVTASVDSATCNNGLNRVEVLVNGTVVHSGSCSISTPVNIPTGTSTILVRAIRWDEALMAQSSVSVSSNTIPVSACPAGSTILTGGSLSSGISNTASGGTLCLDGGSYSVSSTLTVNKALSIVGLNQARITQTFSGTLFQVTASNVTIKGIAMTGAHRNWGNDSCSGTIAVSAGAVSNLTLANNKVSSFTCGFVLTGTNGFSVTDNEVRSVKYASMVASAASNGKFDGNKIYDVNHDGPLGQNAYGITATGNRARNITISNNLVQNAPTWECYDTHDGISIYFLNNTCIGPGRVGINAAYSGVAEVSDIRIEGNTIEAGTQRNQWNSIVLTGTGTVKNNIIKGFGGCLIHSPKQAPSGNICN